jgi:hypothetical protein
VKKICLTLIFIVLIGSSLSFNVAFSQDTWPSDSVITTGIGHITNDNIITAQNEAIIDAQKKALVHAVGMLMTFDLIEEQFPFLQEPIFDRAADYIASYRILYDSTLDDRYHITIQSTIDFKELENYLVALQFLTPKVKLPRILLMISQKRLDQNFYTCWWSFIDPEKELTVIDQVFRMELQKKGFEVIDHTHMLQEKATTNVYGCLDIKSEAIQTLGKQFKADIAIVGTAQVESTDEVENSIQKSVQASIIARAVKIEDGSVVATLDTYIPATQDDEETAQMVALEKASSTFSRQMGQQISLQWVKESKGVTLTTLSVSGLSNYLDFSLLKSDLKKGIPEIQNLLQKTLSDEGALIEVESSLDTLSLAKLIANNRFEEFTISIKNVSHNMIEMEVRLNAESTEQKQLKTNSSKEAGGND